MLKVLAKCREVLPGLKLFWSGDPRSDTYLLLGVVGPLIGLYMFVVGLLLFLWDLQSDPHSSLHHGTAFGPHNLLDGESLLSNAHIPQVGPALRRGAWSPYLPKLRRWLVYAISQQVAQSQWVELGLVVRGRDHLCMVEGAL